MDPRRSSRWACAHHRRYPWRVRLAWARQWRALTNGRSKPRADSCIFGHPQLGTPRATPARVVTTGRARGSLRCAGRNRFRARPCPQGSSNPSLGSDRWRVRLLEPQLLAPAGLPRPRISLHVRCVSMLIRLPPPFHSQFSGSRARIRSPSPNRRHRPPWRTMLPRRSRRVVVAPARPASPQPRAPIGNREGDSRQRVRRWPVHPKRAGAPRSSPARPR